MPFVLESTSGSPQLERPQEVVCLLKVPTYRVNLVDQVLQGSDAVLAQTVLDQAVIGEGNSLLVDFPVPSLVD